ncbi:MULTISPECIES: MFS transporter [Streptacidiphilus]|uniref:MFS transporter n=1 Tax=Streptacidiphilus cavernicola TaxID=3342716 RepID=A0ABV6UGV6_9ACTN|nr:MFS transporter [Streptacidiphilus jeojiense]
MSEPERQPPLWRNGDYVGWWTGNTLSALGTSVSAIAFPLLVLASTGSVSKAGVIGSANLLGVVVTALWGGVLADRVSRRAILVAGPLAQAAVLAAVTVLARADRPSLPLLVAASLLSGLLSGVVMGAGTPALARIVPKEQLATANGQAMSRDMLAQLLGAPVGGVLFGLARWVPFGADALSFVFAALGALNIRRPLGPDRDAAAPRTSVLADVSAGLRFVRVQPFVRFVVVMASVLNMVAQAFLLLLIALVAHRGGGPTAIGLVSATTVAGGFAGSLVAPAVARRFRARVLLCGAVWIFTLGLAVTALVPQVWEIALVVCLTQVATVPVNVVLTTYLMRLVPDGMLGRVAAVNRFGAYALEWCGPLLAGLFVALFGAPGGMLALLVVMVPLAVALMVAPALAILGTPVGEVAELAVPEPAKSAPGVVAAVPHPAQG